MSKQTDAWCYSVTVPIPTLVTISIICRGMVHLRVTYVHISYRVESLLPAQYLGKWTWPQVWGILSGLKWCLILVVTVCLSYGMVRMSEIQHHRSYPRRAIALKTLLSRPSWLKGLLLSWNMLLIFWCTYSVRQLTFSRTRATLV